MNWKRFKYITWPNFYYKWLGLNLIDDCYSYWWLNIKKRKQFWLDASQDGCPRRWCRYCGKGTVENPQPDTKEVV